MISSKNKRLPRLFLIPVILAIVAFMVPYYAHAQNDTHENPMETHSTADTTILEEQAAPLENHAVDEAEQAATEEHSGEAESGHGGGVSKILFGLIIILVAAKIGGEIAERLHQPAVLGELMLGVILGNMILLNVNLFEFIKHEEIFTVLAEIGVIILLFEVGLETNLNEMLSVGTTAFLVAALGVITPFILGWGVAAIFLAHESMFVHIFIGATLCATSVGITARVIKDIKKMQTKEAKIILGAAVIDDIMGLVVLSIVTGLITAANTGTSIDSVGVLIIVLKAVGFITLAIVVGGKIMPRILTAALNLKAQGVLLIISLAGCFTLAALAEVIGLAAIVGAFAAGVIMEKVHYRAYVDRGEHDLEELIYPISTFLVPIFFVHMGIMVDLSTFGQVSVLAFAGILTVAAIVGKQACSLGILEKGLNRLSIGLGMIPRGEVGLIFAKIGHTLTIGGVAVVSNSTYSAVVIMVILTTLVTPPVLKPVMMKRSTEFYPEAS